MELAPGQCFGEATSPFLAALGQEVAEPSDLRCGFVGHMDVDVAPAEDLLFPVVEPSDFAGDLGVDVAHEVGELPGVFGIEQHVAMI